MADVVRITSPIAPSRTRETRLPTGVARAVGAFLLRLVHGTRRWGADPDLMLRSRRQRDHLQSRADRYHDFGF